MILLGRREEWDTLSENKTDKRKKARSFWRENTGFLCTAPIFLVVSLAISFLYELWAEYVFYLEAVYWILFLSALCIQYSSFRRSVAEWEKQLQQEDMIRQREYESWEKLQEKQDFFALWAHQIKTPISALNLLLQGENTDRASCRQELFKVEGYVEMALNYMRFEDMRNDLLLEKYSLEELVRQVVKKYATLFIYNHVSVELQDLQYQVLTDEKWFCFVLEQLISNAIKYTGQGSVTVFAQDTEQGICLVVKDTGIGIKGEDLPRIFEKGFTGYNGRLDKKASGLGLYLCKGVCDRLGHRLDVSSRPGEGTEVRLLFPPERVNRQELDQI